VTGEILNEYCALALQHGIAVGLGGIASARIAKGFVDVVAGPGKTCQNQGKNKIPH